MNIFLSVPFSSRIIHEGVEPAYREQVEKLIAALREKGHSVFCALEYVRWTLGGLTDPEAEFKKDISEIDKADKIIVLLEERISAGIQLENGYAFAKKKLIETYQIGKPAWSNIAFARLNKHEIIVVEGIADFVNQAIKNN